MMLVWGLRGKIIRTVPCRVVYYSYAQWYAGILCEQFIQLTVAVGVTLGFFFVFSLRFCMFCVI